MNTTPLFSTAQNGKTDIWNDSCSIEELTYSIGNGAVGATTNPVIVLNVLKKEMPLWKKRIQEIIGEMPEATEDDVAWKVIEEMGCKGAELLMPVFERENGMKGRLSMQTNPKYYRNAQKMVNQAVHFSKLASNIQVKIPAVKAGIEAIEKATYQGVNINATVSFTVSQAVAVAEAVERGLKRREAEGLSITDMSPVCTIMVGRTDDWMKDVVKATDLLVDPECLEWAGVAVAKKAYQIYQEKGYRTRLLFGALRNHYHWSEFIGGDLVLTISYDWQKKINGCKVPVVERIHKSVKQEYVDMLYENIPDFRKAYDVEGMSIEEFDEYGATKKTIRSFLEGYGELVAAIRKFMLV